MIAPISDLKEGQKIYFASDFHLGVPNPESSKTRELKVVEWLSSIEHQAAAIFILGDIFDFWFEYKYTIPKGFIRLQGKLAQIADRGIPVYFFTGNHDMWMFDYFPKEFGIPVFRKPEKLTVNGKKLLIGHGDGLGPGDHVYKIIKKVFANKICQRAFAILPSNIGIGIATLWSNKSRISNTAKDEKFLNEEEWLYQYCLDRQKKEHFDYYIFGHRHLPLQMEIAKNSKYINLGEWVNYCTYAEFDGNQVLLKEFTSNNH